MIYKYTHIGRGTGGTAVGVPANAFHYIQRIYFTIGNRVVKAYFVKTAKTIKKIFDFLEIFQIFLKFSRIILKFNKSRQNLQKFYKNVWLF